MNVKVGEAQIRRWAKEDYQRLCREGEAFGEVPDEGPFLCAWQLGWNRAMGWLRSTLDSDDSESAGET